MKQIMLKLIYDAFETGDMDNVRKLRRRFNSREGNEQIFIAACGFDKRELIDEILALKSAKSRITIHADQDHGFGQACVNGQIPLMRYLLSLEKIYGPIDIHARSEYAFRRACGEGESRAVAFLLNLESTHGKIDIHTNEDEAFWGSLTNGHQFVTAKVIALQATHGLIDPGMIRRFANRIVSPRKIEQALKGHTYRDAHQCLKTLIRVTPHEQVRKSFSAFLIPKAKAHLHKTAAGSPA